MSQSDKCTPKASSPLQVSASSRSLLASQRKDQSGEDVEDPLGESDRRSTLSLALANDVAYSSLEAPDTLKWKNFIFSPIQTFYRIKHEKEEASQLTPSGSSIPFSHGMNLPLVGEVRWDVVKEFVKVWLRNPKNLALLLWGTAVGISGAILFLVMVGFLDHQLPKKSQRDTWFEVNNQILNALFTLMCLYLHPTRFLHLVMLYRWRPEDIKKLREAYCKGGTYKPHEWAHMLVVVLLLHLNCFAQYALCGLNWGFKRSQRPAIGVGVCLAVAIGAPAAAGIYSIVSPLGKDYDLGEEEELELAGMSKLEQDKRKQFQNMASFKIGRVFKRVSTLWRNGKVVEYPEWRGGLFDCFSDPTVAFFSTFCGFCVFGWNMDRLGFGNRYVHVVTFILLCTAPYWIFTLAAVNIDNPAVRQGLSIGGIVMCVFGLLYGGFWRIQMRKTFGLPAKKWCFGQSTLTDCTQWLFCSICSLCQEVRTSEYYKVRENKFYERKALGTGTPSTAASPIQMWSSPGPSPLGRESFSPAIVSPSPRSTDLLSPKEFSAIGNSKPPQELSQNNSPETVVNMTIMDAPLPPVLRREETDRV